MIPAFHYRTNREDISFTKDDAWHTVSLSSYLEREDTVAVLLEIWNEDAATNRNVGCQTYSVSGLENGPLYKGGLCHYAAPLSGAGKNVKLRAYNSSVHVGIAGEFRGPGVAVNSPTLLVGPSGPSEINTWINRSVTLQGGDSYEDVDSVLLLAVPNSTYVGHWGARALGSTSTQLWVSENPSLLNFVPCATDDGDFQVYFEGKTSPTYACYTWMFELGYVKKGYGFEGIVDFVDDGCPQSYSYTIHTVSSNVPQNARGILAGMLLDRTGPDRGHGLRTLGSSNQSGNVADSPHFDGCFAARLTSQRRHEYLCEEASAGIWPLAITTVAECSASAEAVAEAQAAATVSTFASAAATAEVTASASGIAWALGSSSVVAEVVTQAAGSRPASLTATPAIESMLAGEPTVASVLSADPEVESILTGKPAVSGGGG